MKHLNSKTALIFLAIFFLNSCKKTESVNTADAGYSQNDAMVATDSASAEISSAATQNIEGKKFVRSADVNMEVQDVYKSTVDIEKYLKNNGGFVTLSKLNSDIISDETYNTSDANAILVRKFQTENTMEVRIPTEKLGDFLEFINKQKLFLNQRNISAEDITANMHLAKLETSKLEKNQKEISNLKTNIEKVKLSNETESENNYQKTANFVTDDNLKYSNVTIYLKEPKVRVAETAITNSKNIDNKYKINFLFDVKNAFVEGFYLIQKIVIGLLSIWTLILIFTLIYIYLKKRGFKKSKRINTELEN
ncbi:DUF4349 domain-containing protein [Halpernia frigidisoli]|uniref:DUF4349 domain-containing protein n=1 Tax=Halpernia frigidisoli TaxID=1125876 RepID=A0A1I3I1S3_9FLAO|nr:DUF4349 domain-containing protein [Halpernia frigidisoli]SFI41800.1 protein of unknown function [Halpernia frigidisoli]